MTDAMRNFDVSGGRSVSGPTRAHSAPLNVGQSKKFVPTAEQQLVYDTFPKEDCLKIKAYAGATKTSTLVGIAERAKGSVLYVAFNRAIVEEAKTRFPQGVHTKTAHQLAFYSMIVVGPFKGRTVGNLLLRDIREVLGGDGKITNDWAYMVRATLMAFCNSDQVKVTPSVISERSRDVLRARIEEERTDAGAPLTPMQVESKLESWCELLALHAGKLYSAVFSERYLNVPHDLYLKVWSLKNPRLNYDFILFDEAQDASPVMRGVIEKQKHAHRVYVGDSYQELYAWRGAENALDSVQGRELRLTTSFRFGSNIADVANCLLRLVDERVPLIGGSSEPGQVVAEYPHDMAFYTALHRTNVGIVESALRLQQQHIPFHVVGGVDEVLDDLKSAYALFCNDRANVTSNLLREYPNWMALLKVAERTKDPVLKRTIKFVDDYGHDLPIKIERIRSANLMNASDARVILSTVHKYKGQECDNVVLIEDFKPMVDIEGNFVVDREELFLLYVAATRAKKVLVTNKSLRLCIQQGMVQYA